MNTPEAQKSKYTKMLIVGCTGIALCLIFTSILNTMQALIAIDDKRCDIDLTTANDYTVQCEIDKESYEKFKAKLGNDEEKVPIKELKEEFERKLQDKTRLLLLK
jgi:hypothetical protein